MKATINTDTDTGRKRPGVSEEYPRKRPNETSNEFGLNHSNREELQNALTEIVTSGIATSQDNEITKFWKLSMDMLMKALRDAAEALVKQFPDDDKSYDKQIKRFEDALSTVSWTDNDITLSPTSFYEKFFAFAVSVKTLTGSTKGHWRQLFEHIGALKQCEVARNNLNEVIIDWNTCYICGEKILDEKNPEAQRYDHLTRECEHILPAFTALGYKGLIQTTNKKELDKLDDTELEFFKYEYANAHRCCNQIKSDNKWIKYNNENGQYITDPDILGVTLKNIFNGKKYDCKNIDFKTKTSNTFVTDRRRFIDRTFLKPILAIINRDKTDYGDLFDLNIRIKQVSAIRINIDEFAEAILTGKPPSKPRPAKEIELKEAKLLAYKQFKSPTTLFFSVFNDMFANNNPNYIAILWSKYPWSGNVPRKLVNISRKLFDEVGAENIKGEMLAENIHELETKIYASEIGQGEDEDKIIAFNNTYLLRLKGEYRKIIYDMAIKIDIDILSIPETDKQKFRYILTETKSQDNAEDGKLFHEQFNNAPSIVELGAKVSTKGGNKKNILSNYMVGGKISDEELVDSYKDDILETAKKMQFNPADYGIVVQTTKSGRTSKPPAALSYDKPGRQGIKLGDGFFTPTDDSQFLQDRKGKKYPLETKPRMGKGIYDDKENFFSFGGKKNKSKINKKNKRNKRNKTKKYLHKRKNVINKRVYRNKSIKKRT
jgi:hypothetical protein